MIYGNHDKRKGDIVKIARWDDRALMAAAWLLDFKSNSGPQRRALCEHIACMFFVVADINHTARRIFLAPIRNHKGKNPEICEKWVNVALDDTNLILEGKLK